MERTFVERVAASGDPVYAAEKAGYASPRQRASQNMQNETLRREILQHQLARLFNEALPLAIDTLVSIMRNDKAPSGARVSASKVVLDRTLGAPDEGGSKEPHEMTADEIGRRIDALRQEAANRARPVIEHDAGETAESVFA